MDRLQQKCFFASALLHSALLAGVVVVSAFSKPPPDVPKVALTYVPVNPHDLGNPPPAGPAAVDVAPTQSLPPPPPPPPPPPAAKIETKSPPPDNPPVEVKKPAPPKAKGLLPPKDEPKSKAKPKEIARKPEPKFEPKKAEAPKKDEPKKLNIADTAKLTTKSTSKEPEPKSRPSDADIKKRADQYAKAQADWQKNLASTLGGLKTGLSSPITVESPGAGGAAFFNYGAEIVRRYEANWLLPIEAADDNSVVQVVVTLARNGHVLDARVVRPCGRAVVDKSVRETLQRVREFPPFPPGSMDTERTFNIDFNLKAKRGTG